MRVSQGTPQRGSFLPVLIAEKSRFASDFLRRGNRASWGLKKSRDFSGSSKNRRRNRRESRDFGALRCRSRLKLSENFKHHCSIQISGEMHMDQSLVHTFFLGKFVWTNGPESSSKVSPYTGIGPWMALPSRLSKEEDRFQGMMREEVSFAGVLTR